MKKSPLNRRELLKKSLAGTAVLAGAGLIACTKNESAKQEETATDSKAADTASQESDSLNYIKEDNQMAQSLGYKEDASSVDSSVRVDKGETAGSDQFCKNCQFYNASENGPDGKCQLFPGKLVKAEGWCKSWALKA